MIDIHTHLLPGIDDGPSTWDESLDLCRLLVAEGVRTAVATPHVVDNAYECSRTSIIAAVAELNGRLDRAAIPLSVLPGGEVEMSCLRLTQPPHDEIPTLNNTCYVLVEIPTAAQPPTLSALLFKLMSRGAIPILAHAERIQALQENLALALEWNIAGCYFQIDAESVLGLWGNAAATVARRLIEGGLAHALASDAHSPSRRPPRLRAAQDRVAEWAGPAMTEYLVGRGPSCFIAGNPPGAPPPCTSPRTRRTWLERLGLSR
jgi:protein-tyrosine phosphatase